MCTSGLRAPSRLTRGTGCSHPSTIRRGRTRRKVRGVPQITKTACVTLVVPPGSVGIGGVYMCIYGMDSPGGTAVTVVRPRMTPLCAGYQFVGRTVPMWNTHAVPPDYRGQPNLLRNFDQVRSAVALLALRMSRLSQVRFVRVSEEELETARAAFRAGAHRISITEELFSLDAYLESLSSAAHEIAEYRKKQVGARVSLRVRRRSRVVAREAARRPLLGVRCQTAAYEAEVARWEAAGLMGSGGASTAAEIELAAWASAAVATASAAPGAKEAEGVITAPVAGRMYKLEVAFGDKVVPGQVVAQVGRAGVYVGEVGGADGGSCTVD